MNKFQNLLSPIEIAGTLFRNRIFASPQGFYNVRQDHLPGIDEVAFYERKAKGGFASVCVGDLMVDDDTGTHYPWLISLNNPDALPGMAMVTSAVSRFGAVASAELSHAGMYSDTVAARGLPLYGPVERDVEIGHVYEMPEEIIYKIIESFGRGAAYAKQAGFGMVTIHGGHGWLLSQFMSPMLNTRKDMWGGALENRMRLPLAVIESIRRHVGPKFPIEFRMSGDEADPNGYDITEGIRLAKLLDGKADIIHVSTGNHEIIYSTIITHPSMFVPDNCNVKFAAEIKKHVKAPVTTVGAISDPGEMEEIIASGKADIVVLGRQSLADPDLPIKTATGREDEIQRCMRCMTCFSETIDRRVYKCAINPETGNEVEVKTLSITPAEKKKVLVIGGGPGGMQAALTASRRGHEVILCEKRDRLGGVLLCEEKVPFKQKLGEYLARQGKFLDKSSVDVRLNTEVTSQLVKDIAPEAIIAAMGAKPAVPPIKGIDGENVLMAEDVYMHPAKAGKNVIILGAGLVGLELGIYLAQLGSRITTLEMMDRTNMSPTSLHGVAINEQNKQLGINIYFSTCVKEITDTGVIAEKGGKIVRYDGDCVICAAGQIPLRKEAAELIGLAPEFYQIGDCLSPRNIVSATQEAYFTASNIGRIL